MIVIDGVMHEDPGPSDGFPSFFGGIGTGLVQIDTVEPGFGRH